MKTNRILDYRRIEPWENHFMASGLRSMAEAVGVKRETPYFSAITGDLFIPIYPADRDRPGGADSGITDYLYLPEVVVRAFAAFGRECVVLSREQILSDLPGAYAKIRKSVDRGLPVLAWGIGNVTMRNGDHYSPLPEACLIGGYGENGLLYVNLYCGAERVETDQNGYTAITDGLGDTCGLFFLGEEIPATPAREVYEQALMQIGELLKLPCMQGSTSGVDMEYLFGAPAFAFWADTLRMDQYFTKENEENAWYLHDAPFVTLCTANRAAYLCKVLEEYPELEPAKTLLPYFEQFEQLMVEFLQAQNGEYVPSMELLCERKRREELAAIVRRMQHTYEQIAAVF